VAVQALAAGCDAVVLLDPEPQRLLAVCKAIETAVFLDTLSGAQLDRSKARLATLQNWLRAVEPSAPDDALIAVTPPAAADVMEDPPTPPTIAISREQAPQDDVEPPADLVDAPAPAGAGQTPAEDQEQPEPEVLEVEEPATPESPPRPVEHVVAEQESLTEIANQHGVTVKNLLTWNGLLDPQVQPGQVLRVAPPEEVAPQSTETLETAPEETAAPADETAAPEQNADEHVPEAPADVPNEPAGTSETAPATDAPAPQDALDEEALTTHTVVAGDTLYRIAVTYNTTPERIIELNDIKNSNVVVLGAKLKVPKP
jgi:LysM repeat protein